MKDSPNWCPTLRPTEAEFRRPFTEFVSGVFRQDPGLPMFKVVPPPSWRPRRGNFPDLKSVRIDTPIRQHAFGQKGAYRCMFVEHKPLQVSEFRDITISEADRITGHKGQSGSAAASGVVNHTQRRLESRRALHDGEDIMERSFWSSVTLNPPLYGADTPHSFFDTHLSFGWNLRNLGDLLKTKPVPEIPGVTTPMTYFGMWRSFFGWHKEDADLYSINFHHFGAPKVWYCISPKDQAKFERVASFLFPEESKECSDFLRHKDILISPNLLRTNNIGFVQAKQQPGEFIVLNAAAYHGGFNLGFNCAEAVNFATEDWIDIGKSASRCLCKKDNVRISMSLFDPNWNSDSEEDEDESEETNFDDSEMEDKGSCPPGCTNPRHNHASSSSRSRSGSRKRPPSKLSRLSKKQRLMLHSGQVSRLHECLSSLKSSHSNQQKAGSEPAKSAGRRLDSPSPGSTGTTKKAGGSASTSEAGTPYTLLQQRVHGRSASAASTPGPRSNSCLPALSPAGVAQQIERMEQEEVDGQPQAVIPPPSSRDKYFHLVQRLKQPAKREGLVVVRWLKEGDDGLFRPEPVYWEERPQVLMNVRTQLVSARDGEGNTLQGAALLQAVSQSSSSKPSSSPSSSRTKNVGGSRSGTRSSNVASGSGSSSSSSSSSSKSIHGHTFKLLTLRSRILEHDLP